MWNVDPKRGYCAAMSVPRSHDKDVKFAVRGWQPKSKFPARCEIVREQRATPPKIHQDPAGKKVSSLRTTIIAQPHLEGGIEEAKR